MKMRNAAQTPDRWKVMSDPLGASNGAQKSRPAVPLFSQATKFRYADTAGRYLRHFVRAADRSPMKLYNKPGGRKMSE
jgi:hypothetical protein